MGCWRRQKLDADMNCLVPFCASGESDVLEKPSVVSVQEWLKQHKKFRLNELEPSSFVAGIITECYRLPFLRLPDAVFLLNHRSALQNASFVRDAIDELVSGHCVVECTLLLYSLQPVVRCDQWFRKQRLVVDHTYATQFLLVWKFKHELVQTLFQSGNFFTLDLKSGYHYVDIHEDSWAYLWIIASLGGGLCFLFYHSACLLHAMSLPSLYIHWLGGGSPKVLGA